MLTLQEWKNEIADIPEYDEKVGWYDLETGLTYKHECERERLQRKKTHTTVSKESLEYRQYIKELGGKALRGTKKQKEWAERLRFDVAQKLMKNIYSIVENKQKEQDKNLLKKLISSSLTSHSRFWIENRNKDISEYLDFIEKIQTLKESYNNAVNKSNSEEVQKIADQYNLLTTEWGFDY